jgi:hypothetical protein
MRLFKQLLLLFALIILSLSGMTQKNKADSIEFFNPDNFLRDTLFIKSHFMECGEWGGHLELSKVYLKNNDFYINYQKYSADCNSIKANNGEPIQTLVKNVNKKLLDKDKLLIRQYFHQLVNAKFREPTPMHAGYIFEIKKTDNSINLFVYTWGVTTRNEYLEFIKRLIE